MPPYVPIFPVRLRRGDYEIFMNRSGLSDGHFAMLIPGVGRICVVSSAKMRESDPIDSFSRRP
jgi:hypothetical protein